MLDLTDEQVRMVSQAMMLNVVRSSLETMKILEKNQLISEWHLPYYLLAVTVLELCGKVVLFKQWEDAGKTAAEIKKELKSYSHDLRKIYSSKSLRELCRLSGISRVVLQEADGIYRYDFFLEKEGKSLCVYDAESIKYGLMTEKGNVGYVGWQTKHLLELCENVKDAMSSCIYTMK